MLKEFREFAARGNVIDLAVGVIIGAAFGKVVDVARDRHHHAADRHGARPRRLQQSVRRAERRDVRVARRGEEGRGAPTINYGVFLNSCFEFLIVAFVVFLLVKQINRLKGPVDGSTRATARSVFRRWRSRPRAARRARRRSSRRELARGSGAGPRQRRLGLHEQRQIRIAVLPSFDERLVADARGVDEFLVAGDRLVAPAGGGAGSRERLD